MKDKGHYQDKLIKTTEKPAKEIFSKYFGYSRVHIKKAHSKPKIRKDNNNV